MQKCNLLTAIMCVYYFHAYILCLHSTVNKVYIIIDCAHSRYVSGSEFMCGLVVPWLAEPKVYKVNQVVPQIRPMLKKTGSCRAISFQIQAVHLMYFIFHSSFWVYHAWTFL